MRDKSGYIMILAVIAIAAVMVVIVSGTVFRSLTHLQREQITLGGVHAEQAARSCLQEALIAAHRDDMIVSGTLPLSIGECTFESSAGSEEKIITSTGAYEEYTAGIVVEVQLDPFEIVEWDEAGL